jgi:hypothetical protein
MKHLHLFFVYIITLSVIHCVNSECVKPDLNRFNPAICHGRGVRWNPSVQGWKYYDGFIAMRSNMSISSCQEFCYLTPGCRSAHLRDDHYCELWSVDELKEQHPSSRIITYDCCDGDDKDCSNSTTPSLSQFTVCSENFIHWNKPLLGVSVTGNSIAVMLRANVSSCQQFCYMTSGCKSAVLKQDGECLLMPHDEPVIVDESATFLSYECCQSHDGEWSEWSEFTPCDNETGIQYRMRYCNAPAPTGNGKYCPGSPVDMQICRENPCVCNCSSESGTTAWTYPISTPHTEVSTQRPLPPANEFQSSYGQMLRKRFISHRQHVTVGNEECQSVCLSLHHQVYQLEILEDSTTMCSCSRILIKYLLTFPKRYITTGGNTTLYKIYYSQEVADEMVSVFHNVTDRPLIFYALDDISGGENLGTMSDMDLKYTVDGGTAAPLFDCPFLPDVSAFHSPKATRLHWQNFLAETKHNGALRISPEGMTVSMWFKPAEAGRFAINNPLVMAWNPGWTISVASEPDKVECSMRGERVKTMSYDPAYWTNIALRHYNHELQCSVNATQTTRRTARQGDTLGNHFNIGGWRYDDGEVDNRRFTVCVAHFGLFSRQLSDHELEEFTKLALDTSF